MRAPGAEHDRAALDRHLAQAWGELTAPGAAYELGEVEVRGRGVRVYRAAPPTLREVWLGTAGFADRDYLIYGDDRLTYGQAHERVRAVGAWLLRTGARPGERVAIAMRNHPEWMLVYWACMSFGFAAVGLNAWWTADELDYALDDCRPRAVFCDAERLERIAARTRPGVALVAVRASPIDGAAAWEEVVATPGEAPSAAVAPDDDACILYTSGTTGRPKGAQLTHGGCVTNLYNIAFATEVLAQAAARAASRSLPSPPVPVALVTTPLFHVTANNCLAHPVTAAGGKLVLMHRWDAGEALRLIETERVTTMSGAPTMARELLAHPHSATRDLSSLGVVTGGGAQVPPDLVARIAAQTAAAKPSSGYGMTETCGVVTAIAGDVFLARPESCGPVMPTFDARIVDEAGAEAAPGDVGELQVRGSSVIKGYLNRPKATREAITDGWLRTGDIARLDAEGFVYIVDRKTDMILRGGENVYCAEVEAAFYLHPAVAEVCAFGVLDERLGEEVAAAVRLRPHSQAVAEELRSHVLLHLARYKAPRYIWLTEEPLPRNATGKFLRRELRTGLALEDAR